MKRNYRHSIAFSRSVIGVTLLLLAACSKPTATSEPPAMTSPVGVSPLATSPLATPIPATSTSEPSIMTPPTATGEAMKSTLTEGEGKIFESHPSPDGQWTVDFVAYPCQEATEHEEATMTEQMQLVNVADETLAVLDTQIIACDSGVGAYGLGGLFWSPDSQIFYYTDAREGVPDGGGGTCWDPALWALDVSDATKQRIARIWARSDDGQLLAMWQSGDDQLKVLDLNGQDVQGIPLDTRDIEVCQILWEPKGTSLAYLQSLDPQSGGPFTLTHVDRDGSKPTVLLELENAGFVEATWETPAQIKLSGWQEGERQEWVVDLN